VSSILVAHTLNTTKSMIPAHPLSLTKQQSQSIVLGSVCNKFIHPHHHTRKQGTRGVRREGWSDGQRDGGIYFSVSFCFIGGISNQNPPPPWSLQLQIALPPLPPAVCPAKSAHDVSLSQLWVEIHRINKFVRETRAWDCLHAVQLVFLLLRNILPQAREKHYSGDT